MFGSRVVKRIQAGVWLGIGLSAISTLSLADTNRWASYQGVERKSHAQHYPQHRPSYPQHRPPQYYPPRPHWDHQPVRPGISIQYQAPTTIYQNSQSYSWVNGDPNVARIESSTQTIITDWRHLGLPAPPNGSYWIYENGRYILVPNR